MKESIYTIPISEVFEPRHGCPVCALHKALEERWVQYITGAAMMEPDVRLQTNEEGFCARHLTSMLAQRNRLSVALLLQTRLRHVLERPEGQIGFGRSRRADRADNCFVCNRMDSELARLAGNVAAVWGREEGFRKLYREQEFLCLPHHGLLAGAAGGLRGKDRARFLADTAALLRQGLEAAAADIDAFCRLFDYRSGGETPSGQVSRAVERAGALLCGGKFGTPDEWSNHS